MNFTLAIWQLPFPCFCRKQYFEIASFPLQASARARKQDRVVAAAGRIQLPTGLRWLGGYIVVKAGGLRAFDEKVGLPKFAHSLLASFHTVSSSVYPTPFVFFRIVARHKTTRPPPPSPLLRRAATAKKAHELFIRPPLFYYQV